jgi:hypothetical protein
VQLSVLNDPRIQLLIRALGDPKIGSGPEVQFNSPFQKNARVDSNYHLYVNPRKGKFYDYKSGQCGSISYLFYLLGEAEDTRPVQVEPLDVLRARLNNLDAIKTFVLPVATLPEWVVPVIPRSRAYKYLLKRGLTDDDIVAYRLGEGILDDDCKVVIPSYDVHGVCEYWVARSLNPKNRIKYKNPPVPRRSHVGFLHLAMQHSKSIVLCEGVFSAMVAGRDAVAAYGKFVTTDQLHRIQQAGATELIIALDGDALKETLETAGRAAKMGFTTSMVELPVDKDPADLGRVEFRKLLERKKLITSIGILRTRLGKL